MRDTYLASGILALSVALGGCTTMELGASKAPLDTAFINHEGVQFEFLDTGDVYSTGEAFTPPSTIDCAGIPLASDAYVDAIDAGALLVRIRTQETVRVATGIDRDGQPIVESVSIQPYYGGVLALCEVSTRAKGPDSRSYNIRGLDEYLVKGKGGLISAVGAVVNVEAGTSLFDALLGGTKSTQQPLTQQQQYSWMLWMTDRSTTFTDRRL